MPKMTKAEAKKIAQKAGISFKVDYHTLNFDKVRLLGELATKVGYKKPFRASGSKTRYFFYYLAKK